MRFAWGRPACPALIRNRGGGEKLRWEERNEKGEARSEKGRRHGMPLRCPNLPRHVREPVAAIVGAQRAAPETATHCPLSDRRRGSVRFGACCGFAAWSDVGRSTLRPYIEWRVGTIVDADRSAHATSTGGTVARTRERCTRLLTHESAAQGCGSFTQPRVLSASLRMRLGISWRTSESVGPGAGQVRARRQVEIPRYTKPFPVFSRRLVRVASNDQATLATIRGSTPAGFLPYPLRAHTRRDRGGRPASWKQCSGC